MRAPDIVARRLLPFATLVALGGRAHADDNIKSLVQSGFHPTTGALNGGTPIWNMGVRGQNQLLSIGDARIDYGTSVCLLHDATHNASVAVTEANHRKVISDLWTGDGDEAPVNNTRGTKTAAIALGKAPDGVPAYGNDMGVAPEAKLLFAALGTEMPGDASNNYIGPVRPRGLEYMQAHYQAGARVFFIAWSLDVVDTAAYRSYGTLAIALDTFLVQRPDAIAIVAAGDHGLEAMTHPRSVALCKNCVVVGAQEAYDAVSGRSPVNVATFSVLGTSAIKPDLVAPGFAVVVANPLGLGAAVGSSVCNNIQEASTAYSAAIVAGAALLVRQFLAEGKHQNEVAPESVSGALVRAMLVHSAVPLAGVRGLDALSTFEVFGATGDYVTLPPNHAYGYGSVQLDRVLFDPADGAVAERLYVQQSEMLYASAQDEYRVTLKAGSTPFAVTVAWNDPEWVNQTYATYPLQGLVVQLDIHVEPLVGDASVVTMRSDDARGPGSGGLTTSLLTFRLRDHLVAAEDHFAMNEVQRIVVSTPEAAGVEYAIVITGDFAAAPTQVRNAPPPSPPPTSPPPFPPDRAPLPPEWVDAGQSVGSTLFVIGVLAASAVAAGLAYLGYYMGINASKPILRDATAMVKGETAIQPGTPAPELLDGRVAEASASATVGSRLLR